MKRNITLGIILISALALSSCSTTKLASNQVKTDDDVYYSNATAGEQPEYVYQNEVTNQSNYNSGYADDDYYYYDSYASRINRFGYFSPFDYYNDMYYGYSPYYGNGYYGGYSPYYGYGLGIGFGYGYGGLSYGGYYGYNPYYYGGYYGYSPYSYWGIGYGGGYPYWGGISAYREGGGNARPYRAQVPGGATAANRSTRPIGYNGNYPVNPSYSGRPVNTNSSYSGQRTMSAGRSATQGYSRPQRPTNDNPRPTYQPQVERTYTPPPSPPPSSSGSYGGGGERSGGGGGGGGRPVRP